MFFDELREGMLQGGTRRSGASDGDPNILNPAINADHLMGPVFFLLPDIPI